MTTTRKKQYRTSADSEEKRAAFNALAAELEGELKQGKATSRLTQAKTQAQGLERYSELNQLLIITQCPAVTEVHSYKEWQRLGFQVRKGEKAIKIRAPHTHTAGEEAGKVGFHRASVFDRSQVDPITEPTPEEAAYIRSLGEDDE